MDLNQPSGGGALSVSGGGRESAKALAFGDASSSSNPVLGALSELLNPERSAEQERNAYWAGMLTPSKSGNASEHMGSAMKAQVEAREAQDKLKAAYIPLIMQSMAQQRANELGYAKFAQERLEKTGPLINSALYGMQADGATPTMGDAEQRIRDTAAQYGMQPHEVTPHLESLQRGAGQDGSRLPQYLQQLRVAAAPPAEGIAKFGTNAAGQTTTQNPVAGTVGMPGGKAPDVNPSKTTVKVDEDSRGDIKGYTESLHNKVAAYNDMLQRLNAIGANLDEFQPGKYAGIAGGFASAVKDLANRFPNGSSETIKAFANAVLGSDGSGAGGDPVAAAQFAEALKAQEAIAQTKAMVTGEGTGSRIGQQEVMMVARNIPGNAMDPGAYKKFIDFMRGQGVNAMNKYQGWADHIDKTDPSRLSVHAFDVPYEAKASKQLTQGAFGDLVNPSPVPKPRERTGVTSEAPAAAPKPLASINLAEFEPGAKLGPTGKVYVMDKDGPRPAHRKGG